MIGWDEPDTTYGIPDPQQAKPVCWCERCGAEIYAWVDARQDAYGTYCQSCYDELHPEDFE